MDDPNGPTATRGEAEALHQDAQSLKGSAAALSEESARRTALAADRTMLAAERTYAAWVRTGLAALVSGVGARAILQNALPIWLVRLTASVLILFAAFCLCAAIWREFYSLPPGRTHLSVMPRAVIIPVNLFLVLVTLAALVGNWIK
jgi:putative membrane protein